MKDLSDYLTERGFYSTESAWWNFEFPSGRAANVWLSSTPFTFDMEVDRTSREIDGSDVYSAQTTDQVRDRLNELMAESKRTVKA